MTDPKTPLSPVDCFLFRGIESPAAEAIVRRLPPPVSFRKGAVIPSATDGGRALGVVLCGEAAVKRRGTDGKEQLCNRLSAGDAFGAASLFCEAETVSRVTAKTPCTVWFLAEETLLALIKTEPAVAENYTRFLTDRIRFLNRSLNGLRGGTAADRLLSHLRTLADGRGTLTLPPLSALAAKLDMGRTSIYRALDELEQSGALTKTGKTVTLTRSL